MKQIMILTTISLYLGLMSSCSTPPIEDSCKTGINTKIWHKCINQSLDKKGSLLLDLNDDTKPDFGIAMEKDVYNNVVISNIGYLSFVNPNLGTAGGLRFDYYVEKKKAIVDSSYFPVKVSEGFTVDSSIYNWLHRISRNEPNLVLYTYGNLVPLGQTLQVSYGLINQGDFYIAFRYYDLEIEPKGWKNGWIKLNATTDKITIKEIAYYKTPETKIKVGEK